MKKTCILFAIVFAVPGFAQVSQDSADFPEHKFSLSIQLGEPNSIRQAEYLEENMVLFSNDGSTTQYGWSAGATLRKHTSSTFFYHVRVAYGSKYRSQYDTSYVSVPSGSPHDTIVATQNIYSSGATRTYRSSNFLFGIGGGHEMQFRNFVVRAGGELHYLRYLQISNDVSGTNSQAVEEDSLITGGHYSSLDVNYSTEAVKYPCANAAGIIGHASLEYKLNPSFGIGASFFFGAYYVWIRDQKYEMHRTNSRHFSDSHQTDIQTSGSTFMEYDYSKRQVEFGPLNAQINFVYYFGK